MKNDCRASDFFENVYREKKGARIFYISRANIFNQIGTGNRLFIPRRSRFNFDRFLHRIYFSTFGTLKLNE